MNDAPPSLRMVRVGLPLVAFGVCLLWVLFAWSVLGLLVNGERPAEFILGWPGMVVTVLWPTFLAMQLAGQLLCLGAPKEWNLRGSELPALAVTLLHLGLYAGLFPYRWLVWAGMLMWVLLLLGPALHLIFVTNFAPRIDQEPLGRRAETVLFLLLVLLVFPVLTPLVNYLIGPSLGTLGIYLLAVEMGIALLLMLASLVMFMNLHLALYHAIPRYLQTFADRRRLTEAGWVEPPL